MPQWMRSREGSHSQWSHIRDQRVDLLILESIREFSQAKKESRINSEMRT